MCIYLEKNTSTFLKNLEDTSDDKILIKFNYRDSDQIDIVNIEESKPFSKDVAFIVKEVVEGDK